MYTFSNKQVNQVMKPITAFKKYRLTLAAALVLGFGVGAAQAAFLAPGSTGTITVTAGCFKFGVCEVGAGANGLADDITDNALTVVGTQSTVGSGVAGNGIVGQMNFTVGTDGNSFTLTSYSLDTYTNTAGGNFATMIRTLGQAGGTISDTGVVTLNLTGRTGMAEGFKNSIREQLWNLDSHGVDATVCAPGTGAPQSFTSGTSTNYTCQDTVRAVNASVTGMDLGEVGPGTVVGTTNWSGVLVSAGNVGVIWTGFDGTPYTEIYNVTVTGIPAPPGPGVDRTPNNYTFTAQTDVGLSQTVTSNSQTITGMDAGTSISVANGEYEIDGSGNWMSSAGTINAGQAVRVRHTSSSLNSRTLVTTLTVGNLSRPFTSTTLASAFVCGSNFTMIDNTAGDITGGTNDVAMFWDGTSTTNNNSTDFSRMTLSSSTSFYGANWRAHHIRVFGPGNYTFNTNCSTADLEATGGCTTPGTPPLTMTVGPGQLGAHMLFDWSGDRNIDVLQVWNINQVFGPSPMYTGGGGNRNMVWSLSSTDPDGDGRSGVPMVDGNFLGFSANFNLSTGAVACVTNIPPPMQSEDTNVESRLGAGCSLSATPVNPLERGEWWLLLGFVAWLGFLAKRKQA